MVLGRIKVRSVFDGVKRHPVREHEMDVYDVSQPEGAIRANLYFDPERKSGFWIADRPEKEMRAAFAEAGRTGKVLVANQELMVNPEGSRYVLVFDNV